MKKSFKSIRLNASERNPFSRENITKMYIEGGFNPKSLVDIAMKALGEIEDPKLRVDAACNLYKSFGGYVIDPPTQKQETQITIGFDPILFPNMKPTAVTLPHGQELLDA